MYVWNPIARVDTSFGVFDYRQANVLTRRLSNCLVCEVAALQMNLHIPLAPRQCACRDYSAVRSIARLEHFYPKYYMDLTAFHATSGKLTKMIPIV